MSMSDYLENKVLDHVNGVAAYTAPATLYLALFKSDPAEDGSGTEVSDTVDDTAYARQTITFSAAVSGVCASSNTQTFASVVYGSGAAAYNVAYIGVYDSATAGNLLFYAAMNGVIARNEGNSMVFPSGAIRIFLD